jgi:hypothetical protein
MVSNDANHVNTTTTIGQLTSGINSNNPPKVTRPPQQAALNTTMADEAHGFPMGDKSRRSLESECLNHLMLLMHRHKPPNDCE